MNCKVSRILPKSAYSMRRNVSFLCRSSSKSPITFLFLLLSDLSLFKIEISAWSLGWRVKEENEEVKVWASVISNGGREMTWTGQNFRAFTPLANSMVFLHLCNWVYFPIAYFPNADEFFTLDPQVCKIIT